MPAAARFGTHSCGEECSLMVFTRKSQEGGRLVGVPCAPPPHTPPPVKLSPCSLEGMENITPSDGDQRGHTMTQGWVCHTKLRPKGCVSSALLVALLHEHLHEDNHRV